jgi:hypothetical protein
MNISDEAFARTMALARKAHTRAAAIAYKY